MIPVRFSATCVPGKLEPADLASFPVVGRAKPARRYVPFEVLHAVGDALQNGSCDVAVVEVRPCRLAVLGHASLHDKRRVSHPGVPIIAGENVLART